MKKLLLVIGLLLGFFSFSIGAENVQKSKSPYTLEQIENHLKQLYKYELKRKGLLSKWDLPRIKYYVSGTNTAKPNKQQTKIIDDTFAEFSKIINIPIENHRQKSKVSRGSNISIILTEDFYQTIRRPAIRRLFFPYRTDKSFEKSLSNFKKTGRTSYGVIYNVEGSKVINKTYVLDEVDEGMRKHYREATLFGLYEIFLPRASAPQSDVIRPSIMNMGARVKYSKLFPIDIALLKVLYSDAVQYGMPVEKAIPIMSKAIYLKLGGDGNESAKQ